MTKLCTPISASTSFSNTAESDLLQFFAHDVNVQMTDGSSETVRISATDPGDAIDKIRSMPDEAFLALPRVKPK